MTKEDAIRVLQRNNCCMTHGCKKVESKGNPYQNVLSSPSYYCPECATEESARIAAEIAEAKKVLGF
jgi:hypothetical protein